MSNLGPQRINQSFGDLLQLPNGLTPAIQNVQDGSGNVTPLEISTTVVDFPISSPSGTSGMISDLATDAGSDYIGFLQAGTGAVTDRSAQDKMRERVSVLDFGAVGNGINDDTDNIQNALDYVGANGGGTVYLPMVGNTGYYRTTSVIRIPNYVTLEGTNPLVYPFSYNNGIVADFDDPMQWIIEAKTTSGGANIPYNAVLTTIPDGATYNCSIRNLRISAVNTTPFGGVRMQGSFGPIVENVAIAGVGCGFLLNESLGGKWSVNSRSLYYGMALWNDCNANEISLYATQSPTVTSVPANYQLPFMSALNGQLVPTYNLISNDPYAWSTGLIVGAGSGLSTQTNTINATIETFSSSVFLLNTRSVVFSNLYIEGSTNDVKYAIIAAKSSFSVAGCHAFMSGTGTMFDIGDDTNARVNLDGIPYFNNFGTVYTNSELAVYGYNDPNPASPALNVQFAGQNTDWIAATFTNGWANAGGANAPGSYRKNQFTGNTELKGYIVGGTVGLAAFTLPVGYRPAQNRWYQVLGGVVYVAADGRVVPDTPTINQVSLDVIQFKAEQ